MSFIIPGQGAAKSATPETLFRDLARQPDGPRHLWAHQADILRAYLEHVSDPDLAIELPTGAGKTLVGMLIAEWRRRERNERVVYLCPNNQLARQALTDARRAGVAVTDLTGKSRDWSGPDEHAYRTGATIAVAQYAALFNSKPRFDDAHLLVFDDAHSAAGTIASAWSVSLRHNDPGYFAVLEVLGAGLPPSVAQRYLGGEATGTERQAGHMVAPEVLVEQHDQLVAVLDRVTASTTAGYGWRMIRSSLDACSVFVTADELVVRPLLPPTSTHPAYTTPRQRLYLSATLGSGGELERAFGRPAINRMPAPEGWDERGTGRRFFVFPELTRDFAQASSDNTQQTAMRQFVSDLMAGEGRSLLLTPSRRGLDAAIAAYVPAGIDIITKDHISDSLTPFTERDHAVLALANRYDGIDLPDQTCRLIVLAGLPVGADPQERFLAFTLGARRVLQERMRTRLAQGSGRATRNANDWALVVVLDRQLISFCGQQNAQAETHPEIRTELEFGLENSQGRSAEDLSGSIRSFLDQDAAWREQVEPYLRAAREAKPRVVDADTQALSASAKYEVRALDAAWRGDWQRAVRYSEQALAAMAGGTELRPYQAFWNYVAAQWARNAAAAGEPTFAAQAADLTRAAEAAAARTTWMLKRQTGNTAEDMESPSHPVDVYAAAQVVNLARGLGNARKVTKLVAQTVEDLGQTAAPQYERGLTVLGRLLGATSEKPAGDARADALWRWSDLQWVAWEAKSQVSAERAVSATEIRQANSHLRAAAADLDEELPSQHASVLVSAQQTVGPSAWTLAEEHLCYQSLQDISVLAGSVADAWMELVGRLVSEAPDDELVQAVLSAFNAHGVAPSSLLPRFRGSLF